MADIPLRTYIEQLDNLIERKQVDEVVAHCRHILSLYPKHLDTYRMLGKALLEKGRHGDAADIFQRVLSVTPDDFISHVGMSIVREDEANLDAAIWHMERAFESAPANGAIQQELCRLYGRRDGVVPAKARLTRGALARMYAQGGLYLQAEAELKAALAAEADRIDLLTKLADVYWQTDQPAQAAQTSAAILQKLPYSLEANRILVNVFRAQGRPNDAAVYRQRVEALDPYEAFADPAANGSGAARVDPAKVSVARLEYVPGMEESGSPDWLASIGAKFEEPASARSPEAQPDWLSSTGEAAPTRPADGYQPGQGSVPDWLKDLDANPAGGSATSAPPDWLKDIGRTEAQGESHEGLPDWLVTATGPLPADSVPDWMLQSSATVGSDAADHATQPLTPPAEEASLAGTTAAAPDAPANAATLVSPTSSAAPTPIEPSGEIPDWLTTAVPDEGGEDLPDWLKAITAQPLPEAALQPSSIPGAERPDRTQSAAPENATMGPSGSAPNWLAAAATAVEIGAGASTVETKAPGAVTQPATPTPAPSEATEPEPATATAPEPAIDNPDWLKAAARPNASLDAASAAMDAAAPVAAAKGPAPAPLSHDELPDWLRSAAAVPDQDETPVWLQTAPAGPVLGDAKAATEPELEIPDWLREVAASAPPADPGQTPPVRESGLTGGTGAPAPTAGTLSVPPVELPDYLQVASPEAVARAEQPPEMEPEEEAAEEDELATALPAEIPDWLKALAPVSPDPTMPAPAAAETSAGGSVEDSLSWMDELTAQAGPTGETTTGVPAPEEPPAWLAAPADSAAPEAATPQPTGVVPGGLGEDTLAAEIPPWAQNEEPGPTDTIASWLAGKHVPDWLRQPAKDAAGPPAVEWEPSNAGTPAQPAAVDSLEAAPAMTEAAAPAEAPAPPEMAQAAAPELDSNDPEAAFRWLESLAAQRGARPEELFTSPAEPIPTQATAGSLEAAPVAEAAAETLHPATEPPAIAATAPATHSVEPEPTVVDTSASEPGGLEEFLRQAEAALPVEHLADTTPSRPKAPVEETRPQQLPPELDVDAAMRWLEGLAAQQGAQPEELLTAPEERTLEAPKWVATEQAAAAHATEPAAGAPASVEEAAITTVTNAAPEKTLAAEPVAAAATVDMAQAEGTPAPQQPTAAPAGPAIAPAAEAPSPDEGAEAAMRWLEGLAAKQGARPEELLTVPEERTLEAPAWVSASAKAAEEAVPPTTEASPFEAITPAASTMAEVEPETAEPEPQAATAPETPQWLKALAPAQEQAEAAQPAPVAPTEPEAPAEPEGPASTPVAADLDKLSRLSERLAAARRGREAEMEARFAEQRNQQEAARRWVEERLASKHTGPLPAVETEPAPAAAPATSAGASIAAEAPAEQAAPTPTTVVEEAATEVPTPAAASRRHPRPSIRAWRPRPTTNVVTPAAAPEPAVATPVPPVPAPMVPVPADALMRGQAALSSQDYTTAVAHLAALVEQGQHLDTVVQSLESATGAGPAPAPVLRLLGDAYVRTDQLQKALDTYRQALRRL